MTRARSILALLLALCAAVVTGCAGFPTSGPPEYGLESGGTGDGGQNVAFIPNRPQPGATPQQIVEGFIDAGSGPGLAGNWAVAREFLAPSLRDSWNPGAGVIVDERAERAYDEPDDGVVDFIYDAVGTVDAAGGYENAERATARSTFRLAQQADGEWRITEAPDGIWLDDQQFPTVFHRYPLMYFDPTYTYLVPDVRWFPVATRVVSITTALVNEQPSEWLAESVATAFPDDVTAVAAVPVDEAGVAVVELSEGMLRAGADFRDRMLTQLEESLRAAGVTDVVMSVDSTPVEAQPVTVRSTRVPAAPLVQTEGGFGFLTGDEIDLIPGLSTAVEATSPTTVQVSPDRTAAAATLASGDVARLTASSTEAQLLDTRGGLIDPTIDPHGYVWSVPRGEPTAVHAYGPGGDVIDVDVTRAWGEASAIAAMSLSRDGARIAAAVTAGGRTALWVAGVVRNTDNVPVALGPYMELAVIGDVSAVGLTWIDDVTVGVLGGAEGGQLVFEQVVGGTTSTSTAPGGTVSISGGSGASSLRLRADDGTLFVKRGASWQPTATGVRLLATQQGAPQ